MKMTLNESEIARAIQVYIAAKIGLSLPERNRGLVVKIQWRSRQAIVEVKPVPTLTDAVEGHTA